MKPTVPFIEYTIANACRGRVIVSVLTVTAMFIPLVIAAGLKQDMGPAKGPGRQSDLKYLGQLHSRRSEEIGGSCWGISCHWIVDPHELTIVQQVEQLARLGAKWGFLCPDWNRIETEKGKYDFNSPAHPLDDAIDSMVKRKIAPIIQIYGGNQLYMSLKLDCNKRQMADAALLLDDPVVRQAWHRYMEAMVHRYKTYVRVWEIWNEPNSGSFWQKAGKNFTPSVKDYGRIVKEATSVIRRIQPEAVIIAGSTAHVRLDYLDGFLSSEGVDYFDHWSVHPYGELPELKDAEIRRAQEILADHGRSPVLWQSECGFPSSADTGGWGWGGPWNEIKHAKWVLRRLLSDAALGMQTSIYFVLNDYPCLIERGPDRGTMGINRKGLHFFGSWKPKPAAHAFRHLASLIDNRLEPKPLNIDLKIIASGGSTYVAGKLGKAVDLSGSDYYYNPSPKFDFGTNDFAVAFWYQSDHVGSENPFNEGQMVTKDNASSARPGWGVNLTGTDPKAPVIAYDVDSGGFRYDHPTPTDDITVYHHIVLQRNGDDVESWLDGKLVSIKSGADHLNISTPSYSFAVGARGVLSNGTLVSGGGYGLDGRIDELWVFNQALMQDQIETLIVSNEVSNSRSILVAHYPFDNTLKDTSSNGLHLTTVGGSSDPIRTYTLKEKTTDSPVVVYWLAVPMQTDFTAGKVQILLSGKPIDEPVLVDLLDGCVYVIDPIEHEHRMVFEGLPVADSPMVLCSRRLLE
ncbi:MAG: hypothetical protein JXD22_02630 [Sedimentisphaerales bacterium]|nr:hypothetical protein [Sedimentisphaerales bacterium]